MIAFAKISIHAPRAGCDVPVRRPDDRLCKDFNPRTPCGVRLGGGALFRRGIAFQSTHPVRGATRTHKLDRVAQTDFNPRTPCGVRLDDVEAPMQGGTISIHAPRAGCDRTPCGVRRKGDDFNPRTPCGVRPINSPVGYVQQGFQSTHPVRGATWRK